jgi:hypothetical protein
MKQCEFCRIDIEDERYCSVKTNGVEGSRHYHNQCFDTMFFDALWKHYPIRTEAEGYEMPEDYQNKIEIVWGIDDVQSVASDLTDEQCREVLRLAKKNHDANEGINWIVLETIADIVRRQS